MDKNIIFFIGLFMIALTYFGYSIHATSSNNPIPTTHEINAKYNAIMNTCINATSLDTESVCNKSLKLFG